MIEMNAETTSLLRNRFAGAEEFTAPCLAAILEDSYESLSYLFTASELLAFISEIQDWEIDDDVIRSLDDIAFHLDMGKMGKKLVKLTLVQKVALVDIMMLSKRRHPGKPLDLSMFDEIGVKFKAQVLRERSGRFAAKMGPSSCSATN